MAQTRKTAKKSARTAKKKASSVSRASGKKTAGNSPAAAKKPALAKKSGAADNGEHPTVTMVRGLAKIVKAHSLSELIVDSPELTLTLRRSVSGDGTMLTAAMPTVMAAPQVVASPPVTVAAAAPAPAAPAKAAPEPEPDEYYHLVTSPFVGTFYTRPNPDAAPYVEIGARIEKGHALCIVEAMKLMNEIEADASGQVVAVLVDDGDSVEYGQALFKIDPA